MQMADLPSAGSGAAYGLPPGESGEQSLLRQYLQIAFRRRWLILASIAAGLIAAVLVTLLMTPKFTSSVELEIARESSKVVNIDGVTPEASAVDQEFYQTQYGLLEARSLAARVARDLRLDTNADFLNRSGLVESDLFDGGEGQAVTATARNERIEAIVDVLLENVEVSPARASRLVTVSYTDADPATAARIANAWANGFIAMNLERRYEASSYARTFLEERLADIRSKLDESERKLVDYATANRIVNIETSGPEDETSSAGQSIESVDLLALNNALAEARARRIDAEAAFNRAKRSTGSATTSALANPGISSLRARRAEIAAQVAQLETQFGPDYPPLVALKAELSSLSSGVRGEESRVLQTLQTQYETAQASESALANRVAGLKGDLLDLRRRSIQYDIFAREVDTNRQLYDGLLQRYKEIGIAAGIGVNNISVVDAAKVPEAPSQPRPLLNALIGLALGLLTGVAIALALDQMDETVSDPATLNQRLGLPLLGTIPTTREPADLADLSDSKSEITEAYLSVTTALRFATEHGFPRLLAITSSRASEGKSTTSLALAATLARQGHRTLLLDADMRSPSVHHWFGEANNLGTSNLLAGEEVMQEAIRPTPIANLSAMFAGPQPPNAADLLSSGNLADVLSKIRQTFDYVVVDSPPVLGLADAPLIANQVEATVFVIEAHQTSIRLAQAALRRMRATNSTVVGAVLAKLQNDRVTYGYEYGYSYGSSSSSRASTAG